MCENDIAVATHGLTKIYGGVKRVDDVSLSVRRGEIFGLIGKNGAGKTTLIRMILGIASPSSGSVEIGGMSSPAALASGPGIGYNTVKLFVEVCLHDGQAGYLHPYSLLPQ